ncbi:MAG: ABC transporter permease [Candidatus Bathyarchaeia archaeon]
MLKGFGNFLLKELKELIRDPKIFLGMIIIPVIMFPLLGGVMNFSIQSAQEEAAKATILIINYDGGDGASLFISYLNSTIRVISYTATDSSNVTALMSEYNVTDAIVIPSDFSANLTAGLQVQIEFYSVFSSVSIFSGVSTAVIDSLIEQFNRGLRPNIVVPTKAVIVKGQAIKGLDVQTLSNLMISQAIAMPVIIMILLSYSMQIAATSVAMEKEAKTLETLLTLPMDRFSILLGKLSGSIIVAAIGALAYMAGFTYYLNSLSSAIPSNVNVDLAALGLVPSMFGYALLGISLFVTLLSALALAVIISAFAEDVRGAQSLVGYIYPLIFIPSLALMYLDVNTIPIALRILIYAIPYSHPIITSKAVIMGDYMTAMGGIAYVAIFTVAIMYFASRLFATEKILTAKLKFKGLIKRKEKAT